MALDLAEQELGISPVLSSTEMASMSEPDQLGLIAYLSQVFDAFEVPPGEKSLGRAGSPWAAFLPPPWL